MKNKMRNTEFLQRYTPSKMRNGLLGNLRLADGWLSDKATTKEYWLNIFNECIEDLQKGYYINGCVKKNHIEYWQEQMKICNEFKPKK